MTEGFAVDAGGEHDTVADREGVASDDPTGGDNENSGFEFGADRSGGPVSADGGVDRDTDATLVDKS
jgi:hypothetical protein